MEVRPSSSSGVLVQLAVLAAVFVGAWAFGHYADDPARPTATAARPSPPAPRAVRPAPTPHLPELRPRVVNDRALRTPHVTARPRTIPVKRHIRRRPSTARRIARSAPIRHTSSEAPPETPVTKPAVDPVPQEPLAISGATVTSDSSTLDVTWQTNVPSIAQGADALGAEPVMWAAPATSLVPSDTHETDFTGLDPATTYHLWLRATDEWSRTTTLELNATTAAAEGATPASVSGSTIVVAGRPFFPIAVWDECTNFVPARIAVGINLFMGEGCGHESQLTAALQGRAYAVVDGQSDAAKEAGVIGWYYEDELDGRQSPPFTPADVSRLKISPPPGMLSFLTLTNHFYSGAAPLWFGRSLYPAFAALADVLGFDLYPLQNWCRSDKLGDVYDAQRELVALAQGKPTFQWIEVRQMDCSSELAPTPQTVAAETWLAIAGGATGIGYFPHDWTDTIGTEIQAIDERIAELKPALLAPAVAIDAAAPLKVGARSRNGALYVIAVNPTENDVDGTIRLDGAGTRTFDVLGEGRTVAASDDVITDSFAPLAVHIYVSAPAAWAPGYLPP